MYDTAQNEGNFARTIILSSIVHLCFFAAALFISASGWGGSGNLSDEKVLFVSLAQGVEEVGTLMIASEEKKDLTEIREIAEPEKVKIVEKKESVKIKEEPKEVKIKMEVPPVGKHEKDTNSTRIDLDEKTHKSEVVQEIETDITDKTNDLLIQEEASVEVNKETVIDQEREPAFTEEAQAQVVDTIVYTEEKSSIGDNLLYHESDNDTATANVNMAVAIAEETINTVNRSPVSGTEAIQTDTGDEELWAGIISRIGKAIERNKVYPIVARKRGMEGTVHVSFIIESDGTPNDISILKSSGFGILDRATMKLVRKAAPFPYIANRVEVPVVYKLN